jgi:hypothetical protein
VSKENKRTFVVYPNTVSDEEMEHFLAILRKSLRMPPIHMRDNISIDIKENVDFHKKHGESYFKQGNAEYSIFHLEKYLYYMNLLILKKHCA